jgi:3-deoxy-manno-octulosonate cytidylyltransferase (CMP-KDO synthetase)
MRTIAIVPARYGSSRLPGKPLKDIAGKPMVQHVYERVKAARLIDEVIVATDDTRVASAVESFGGKVAMTSVDHPNGTSRAAEVVAGMEADIVINVQGDEPLISPRMIDELAQAMQADPPPACATLCYRIGEEHYHDPNVVKVVMDRAGNALYFSRSLIPYGRNTDQQAVYEHIGIYGYTKEFLLLYVTLEETPLANTESLEQLRVLENGYPMRVMVSKHPYEALSVDDEDDLRRVREIVSRAAQDRNR